MVSVVVAPVSGPVRHVHRQCIEVSIDLTGYDDVGTSAEKSCW